jgi:hypothetical protein
MSAATYSFLPYLRQGLANSLKNTGGVRAVYTVQLGVQADGVTADTTAPRDIALYGPGDIVGIDTRAILKTDPLPNITNFEPNYVAYIDFYEEDYPWRYTPVTPESERRLKSWLALVVLKTAEFSEGSNLINRPLPYFTLKGIAAGNIFPKASQLWAWSHVHVNIDVVNATIKEGAASMGGVLDKLQSEIHKDRDVAFSRIVCPRKLEPSTAYHAFLIPAFESGRLAGLGDTAANIAAAGTKIAWADGATPVDFPIYYRWQFSTGSVGDFEYLVRILVPKPADLRVGRRDMDMTRPGANLEWQEAPDLDLGGILRLGGALQVPRETLPKEEREKLDKLDGWGADRLPHPFQKQIATLLNLADEYSYKRADGANADAQAGGLPIDPNEDADPLITPPIYGRWHAMIERVLEDRNGNPIHHNYNWINELNLDPRYRVPAHFGTRVVQENQEDYMNAAWEQIGDVLKANEQIRYAQFAMSAANIWYAKHVVPMASGNPAKFMMLSAPVQRRVLMDGLTVHHLVRESVLPAAVVAAPMRRITRSRGRLARQLQKHAAEDSFRPELLVSKLAEEKIHVSPPKEIPPELPSASKLAETLKPPSLPNFLAQWLRKMPELPWAILVMAVIIIILLLLLLSGALAWGLATLTAAVAIYLFIRLYRWQQELGAADGLKPAEQRPEVVDRLPKSPDFTLEPVGSTITPIRGGSIDSQEAVQFKAGLRDAFELVAVTRETIPEPAPFKPIDIEATTAVVATKLDPEQTIPKWTWANIHLPDRIRDQLVQEVFTQVMNYPRFDYPMYKPLVNISAELFLPNINLIEYNSITLLETNQEFIETYMVGLNHEFARELLWREYPTDQRGSYFRQFWDVSTLLASDSIDHSGLNEEEIRELYRDIPKLHLWPRASKLGEHDHRQMPGEPEIEEVVLVIRGELLKKYPNAVVYAHKAVWAPKSKDDPTFDKTKSRVLYKPEEGDKEKPSFDVIRTPLYRAQVEPDIAFFGFKLDIKQAKGESDPQTLTVDNAGWFFVIKERPGEPRFGLDIPTEDVDAAPNLTWNDVSWTDVLPGNGVIDATNPAQTITLATTVPANTPGANEQGFLDQRNEDLQIKWNGGGHAVDAADLAYILYQVPVLVAVHAAEMLPKNG